MSGVGQYYARFGFVKHIAAGDGDIDLIAAPGAGKAIVVEKMTVTIVTAAAQAVDIEDNSGTVEVFKAPASLAAGNYIIEPGDVGLKLTTNEKLYWNSAAAGVAATVSAYGRIIDV